MKKSILTLALFLLFAVSANGQIMNIHLKNGNVIPVPLKDIANITYDMESTLAGKKAELVSDPVISDMMQLAVMVQQYYRKPAALGGGGNSFTNWVIPESLANRSPNGTYSAKVETEKVTLVGLSKTTKKDGKPLKVTMVVTKDSIAETTVD